MKISLDNLTKIMERCTKKEIDLLIYICQFQDEYGVIEGIDYKDVTAAAWVSKSYFYQMLQSLEAKEIININYANVDYAFWSIKLIDNEFKCNEDYKKGYIKLNYSILHSRAFKYMTKSEKIIVLKIIKINDMNKHVIRLGYKKLMEWTGKSLRSVKKFVETLTDCLNIRKRDSLIEISCLSNRDTLSQSNAAIKNNHLINYRLKRAKCQANTREILGTELLIKQFIKKFTIKAIIKAIDSCLMDYGYLNHRVINFNLHQQC